MIEQPHMVIIRPASAWADQASKAMERIEQANGGVLPEKLIDGEAADHEAFVSLIEALVALESVTGRKVDQELIDRAGLRPVDEVI